MLAVLVSYGCTATGTVQTRNQSANSKSSLAAFGRNLTKIATIFFLHHPPLEGYPVAPASNDCR